ncbi:hypothetical protein NDS46_30235 (plasmid) [Paenibacillus thiaminolyticus]|uniref:JAB domain-containing protein n=1 Tax=Paenibacillus thiaminolyticus TaxID=49283 RepID=UPI00232DBA1F|nr:JAB domain-containing protein [Paenibacillus thiaminolyticus]WCF11627.1 hypothetical protein NDS46_30235 [Paenibacillus thiaminolyticus]
MEIPIYRTKLEKWGTLKVRHKYIKTPAVAAETVIPFIHDSDKEYLIALYLVNDCILVGVEVLAIGSCDSAVTSIREMLRGALIVGATGVIIAHNHPHGTIKPSKADIATTKAFQKAAEQQGIQLRGSLIVNMNGEFHDIMSVPELRKESMLKLHESMNRIQREGLLDKALFWINVGTRMITLLLCFCFWGYLISSFLQNQNEWKTLDPFLWSFAALLIYLNVQAIRWASSLTYRRFPKVMPYHIEDNHSVAKNQRGKINETPGMN